MQVFGANIRVGQCCVPRISSLPSHIYSAIKITEKNKINILGRHMKQEIGWWALLFKVLLKNLSDQSDFREDSPK